jgi:hypothetical protein
LIHQKVQRILIQDTIVCQGSSSTR